MANNTTHTLVNGARITVVTVDTEREIGKLYVTIPANDYGMVWKIADWCGTGPFTMPVSKRGRFASKFEDVYTDEITGLVRYLNKCYR